MAGEKYLLFGHFYGECLGEQCIETYKLTDSNLYEDLEDNYGGGSYDFVEMSNAEFELVQDLMTFLPQELLSQPDQTFGCPDCLDQGGVLISHFQNGTEKTWRIDNSVDQVPEYLHDFVAEVHERIALLSN